MPPLSEPRPSSECLYLQVFVYALKCGYCLGHPKMKDIFSMSGVFSSIEGSIMKARVTLLGDMSSDHLSWEDLGLMKFAGVHWRRFNFRRSD